MNVVQRGGPMTHAVSETCSGEICGMCWRASTERVPATHKVGEEIASDQPRIVHNLTQYVCCRHFGMVMGPESARKFRGCAE